MIRLFEFDKVSDADILTRAILAEEDVNAAVDAVLAAVRTEGDAALRRYEKQFDGAELDGLFVTEEELDAAWAQVERHAWGLWALGAGVDGDMWQRYGVVRA